MIKKLVYILIIVFFILSGVGKVKKQMKYNGVVGYSCSYTFYHRSMELDNFKDITLGTQYKKIVDLLGEPNGLVGSGILWPYYQLNDGTCVILLFNKTEDRKREFTTLKNVKIVDTAGRMYVLEIK